MLCFGLDSKIGAIWLKSPTRCCELSQNTLQGGEVTKTKKTSLLLSRLSSLTVCGWKKNYIKIQACLVVKFQMTSRFLLKQLDYLPSISVHSSWLGLCLHLSAITWYKFQAHNWFELNEMYFLTLPLPEVINPLTLVRDWYRISL